MKMVQIKKWKMGMVQIQEVFSECRSKKEVGLRSKDNFIILHFSVFIKVEVGSGFIKSIFVHSSQKT